MSRKNGFLKGLMLGSVFGGIAALLFAPKSGKELRADLKDNYYAAKKELDKKVAEIKPKTEEAYKRIVAEVTETVDKVKELSTKDFAIVKSRLESTWNVFKKDLDKKVKKARKVVKKTAKQVAKKGKAVTKKIKRIRK